MSNCDGNSEKFLTTYNELDKYMRKYLNESEWTSHIDLIRKMVKKDKFFKNYEYDLRSYADLRNAIVHNPDKREANPIAEPHDYIIIKYEDIKNKVMNPPVALNTIAISSNNIFTTTLDSNALNVIKEMNKNIYTHVPVVEDGKMIGIFSENTIFSYIACNEDVIIEKDTLIREFTEFIPRDSHESECFKFVNRDASIVDIEEIFQNEFKDKRRVAVVFITETGSEKEKLLGLVTAWDLAGYDK